MKKYLLTEVDFAPAPPAATDPAGLDVDFAPAAPAAEPPGFYWRLLAMLAKKVPRKI